MLLQPAIAAAFLALFAGGAVPAYSVTDRIAGPDGGWDLAAVDPVAHRLYVARSQAVMAVDLTSGKVMPALSPLSRGHGVLAIPGTNRVIATSGALGTATLFEGDTGKVIADIAVGKNPDAIAYDPATRTVWVMNPGSHEASVIDPATASVVATVPIAGALELAAADGEGRLYVNVEDKNEVAVVDTKARKVIAHYPLAGCDGATGIAYSLRTKLIVSACDGVAKVTAADGHEVASLKIGAHPDGAVIDETRGLVLIPTGGDGMLSVIRLLPKPEVVAVIPTAKGARTAAIDPATGVVYLPSARYGAAPATGGRAPILPGSFAVLVVTPR